MKFDMKLEPAREWTFTPWCALPHGFRLERLLLKQAAFVRNLEIDQISPNLYVVSNGVQKISFSGLVPETTTHVARIASVSKPAAKTLLARAGLQVPTGGVFSRNGVERGCRFAKEIGFPVVVKPTRSSYGYGVTTEIRTEDQFRVAWTNAQTFSRIIVEKHVPGNDFRLHVVGDKLVAAVRRIQAYVDGDGRSSISELIAQKNETRRLNPYLAGKLMKLTPVMVSGLQKLGLSPDSVPEMGHRLRLPYPVRNITTGGENIDVTDHVHREFQDIAVAAGGALPGTINTGLDLLAEDISAPAARQEWAICEINTQSGFAIHHFPFSGTPRDVAGALIEYLFSGSQICGPSEQKNAHAVISGKVIGTGFRRWISRRANVRGLTGRVHNRADGTVEAMFCGAPNAVDDMLELCRTGPRRAVVENVVVSLRPP